MKNQLEQLREMTRIVADTGDVKVMQDYSPEEATTNPSLLYASATDPNYRTLVERERERVENRKDLLLENLWVSWGAEILHHIPGRVSTEIDPRLSFDREENISAARRLIKLYEERGIQRERVLIKIASTWEGIQAAKHLEREGIHCNMTLLFHHAQAMACADAGVTLISPFVGRIWDWYQKNGRLASEDPAEDPGVRFVKSVHQLYKRWGCSTEVMGASFRRLDQVLELAGIDALTLSPTLLAQLQASNEPLERKLFSEVAEEDCSQRAPLQESEFHWQLCCDPMATEKLAEGICKFHADTSKLYDWLSTF